MQRIEAEKYSRDRAAALQKVEDAFVFCQTLAGAADDASTLDGSDEAPASNARSRHDSKPAPPRPKRKGLVPTGGDGRGVRPELEKQANVMTRRANEFAQQRLDVRDMHPRTPMHV